MIRHLAGIEKHINKYRAGGGMDRRHFSHDGEMVWEGGGSGGCKGGGELVMDGATCTQRSHPPENTMML